MKVLVVARAAGCEEVGPVRSSVVAARALFLHHQLFLIALVDLEPFAINAHPAIGAVEEVPNVVSAALGDAAFAAGGDAAYFEDNLFVAIIEGGELRVGRLLIVRVDVLASGRDHALRE